MTALFYDWLYAEWNVILVHDTRIGRYRFHGVLLIGPTGNEFFFCVGGQLIKLEFMASF